MRKSLQFIPSVLIASLVLEAPAASPPPAPLAVVNRRMELYNNHDVEAMLALYSADVTIFTYPDTRLGAGKDHMRKVLHEIFADGDVRVAITRQMLIDGYVINEELVSYAGKPTKYVSIYEVRNGLITSVRFVRDRKP